MAFDLSVRGQLVLANEVVDGWLGVEDGRVARISSTSLPGRREIDFGSRVVLPGVVDFHAHFSDPGRAHWEGWTTGSQAASAGGITTVVDMPLNAIPATVNRQAFELKLRAADGRSLVDYALWGGLVDNNLADLGDLTTTGVVGIKAFMVDTKDQTFRFVDDELLRRGMELVAPTGLAVAVHAEDNQGTWANTRTLLAAGRRDPGAWLEARTAQNELTAILRALELARQTGCRLHVVHVSIPEGVAALGAARASGQKVTWETCAHYLALTDEDFLRIGPEAKCAPPLRDRERQEALWEQVLSGQIDAVTSDHSPCPWEDKAAGQDDIWRAWGGISGIQCLLPVMLTEGVARRGLAWTEVARLLAQGPAELAGLADRKGSLAEGLDADFSVVDPTAVWTLTTEGLHSRNRHSAFVGRRFQGVVESTFLRGRAIWDQGRFDPNPEGRYLPWGGASAGRP